MAMMGSNTLYLWGSLLVAPFICACDNKTDIHASMAKNKVQQVANQAPHSSSEQPVFSQENKIMACDNGSASAIEEQNFWQLALAACVFYLANKD